MASPADIIVAPARQHTVEPPLALLKRCGLNGALHAADEAHLISPVRGAYLLLVRLAHPCDIQIARKPPRRLEAGWYAYAGSACGPGGLKARLGRHLARNGRPHWHIDRLTIQAADLFFYCLPGGFECDLVTALLGDPACSVPIPGFGSSDCTRCRSHLVALGLGP